MNNFRYSFTATSTTTNTIDQVRWLWEQDVYTNIALPAWKEAVRTDSTSTFSNSDLTTVTVGTPFFIKVTGGVPYSQFSYTAAVPPIAAIPAGNRLLDSNGDYTFTATTVTLVDQSATSTNYSMDFTFNATNSSTQLRFTASQPIP